MSRALRSAPAVAFAFLFAPRAEAQSYRLRADVFAETPDPSAFVMLQAEARAASPVMLDAEAVVWAGLDATADGDVGAAGEAALVSVHARAPDRLWEARAGRQIYFGGALRPLYFDGAVAGLRAPSGTALELLGGVPVRPRFEGRSFDWLLGQRFTQALGDYGRVGFSYLHERDEGRVAYSELGVEAVVLPFPDLALSGTAAIDLERLGLAQARASAVWSGHDKRLELFGVRRSPDHLLPATSLFAALGAYDADLVGLTGFWRVAPRLELTATATVERVIERPAATQLVRADLRLDDEGAGVVGLELRRESVPLASWSGARGWVTLPIAARFAAGLEAELAVPDDGGERGLLWPWAFLSGRYKPLASLEVAAGVEASSTPDAAFELGGQARVSGVWAR